MATKLRRRGGWRGTPVELFASVEHHAECAGEFAHALEALDRLSRLPRRQVLVSGRPHRIELSDPTPDNGRAPGVGDAEFVGGSSHDAERRFVPEKIDQLGGDVVGRPVLVQERRPDSRVRIASDRVQRLVALSVAHRTGCGPEGAAIPHGF